ncbi:MAG: ATP-binding protein [Rhodospirillaceae bacterium]
MRPPDPERLLKRLEREKLARLEAERLLEEKSLSLYLANQEMEAAHRSQKRIAEELNAILENIPRGIILTDAEGTILTVNRHAEKLFDVPANQAEGINLKSYLSLDELADLTLSNPVVDAGDLRVTGTRADKSTFPVELAFTTVGEEPDIRVLWMVRDIALRLAAEAEQRQLEQDLKQAQKLESLGTLAGGIAHELNTPIQFVTDNMNFLSEALADLLSAIDEFEKPQDLNSKGNIRKKFDIDYLAEEAPQAISQSLDGLRRIADIVLAVKKFSYPTSTGKSENDLNDIIRTTVTVSKNQWKYVAGLDLDLDEDLPLISSNAGELNQVFLNLIVNAAHAIEDKVDKIAPGKISVQTKSSGSSIECRVSDNGSGMTKDVVEKIFDPFFTTKDPGRGTGQGLSIVHSIVTLSHGGDITVESEVGQGTTFVLTFPVRTSGGTLT